ncbi:MAG: glycine--tRNA ligase subunit beta [Chromatiales bacterium]|jgi:glycyl-tRNA synthetase beta chain|nr:glycine--tRNA ligase subunit beta [Chromatiales bacterium]
MDNAQDLLVEIGTEELPPKALRRLSEAFEQGILAGLAKAGIAHGTARQFATPRRLAVIIDGVAAVQPQRESRRRGPALKAAFDDAGTPTKAAMGFARSCGVEVSELDKLETDQGAWLVHKSVESATDTGALLPEIVGQSLDALPIPKRMRWGASDAEFVRPVRSIIVLMGTRSIQCQLLGVKSGQQTLGHRFHCPDPLTLTIPDEYEQRLEEQGFVVAGFDKRRTRVLTQVREAAAPLGGEVVIDEALLDEVTALTEWPVAIAGSFEEKYLEVPAEALIATMKTNQKYFHLIDGNGDLLPHFITVANIESSNPDAVRHGNERVVRPRLADAQFFFEMDKRTPLASRLDGLETVVFQRKLGSLKDKSERIAALAEHISRRLGESDEAIAATRRAGLLCKCDLVTEMVGEFPELQGSMGGRYAEASGESASVSQAIAELYLPRFAGDALPTSRAGMAIAIADRIDTLVGIFGIGQPPSGDKDPFALRRAALGVLRIMIEGELDLDVRDLLTESRKTYEDKFTSDAPSEQLLDFMLDRLRGYFTDGGIGDAAVSPDVFVAVAVSKPSRPVDFARRVQAVQAFRQLPAASALAAANKRIQNILRQVGEAPTTQISQALLSEPAERELAKRVAKVSPTVAALLDENDYGTALQALADLRKPVDAFFDTVRVMADDAATRDNRIALLNAIGSLFMRIADISQLRD